MAMVKVKICGLTRVLDIEYVNELKPDYIGFVFANSKRRVSADQALELSRNLSKGIKTVGVFVNEDINTVREVAEKVKLDILNSMVRKIWLILIPLKIMRFGRLFLLEVKKTS